MPLNSLSFSFSNELREKIQCPSPANIYVYDIDLRSSSEDQADLGGTFMASCLPEKEFLAAVKSAIDDVKINPEWDNYEMLAEIESVPRSTKINIPVKKFVFSV